MRKWEFIGVILITALLALSGTVYAIHETQPAESVVALPGPNSTAVYQYINVEDPYKDWQIWPGKDRKTRARAPLNRVTTYVNDNAIYSIYLGKPMVNGSFIVTENYDDMGKLTAIFVMYKIKNYNPSAGNWFWAQYTPDGKTVVAGKVKQCIQCHSKVKENDYVFTEKFIKGK